MAPNYSGPSGSVTTRHSFVSVLKLALEKYAQNTDDMLPARVVAFDRAENRAQVQPLIYMITTDNRRIERAPIASVPVLQLGGGGFVLSFPLLPGDLGWIKANDRDISNFKANLSAASPQTWRKHTFEDALFIPDSMMRSVTINAEDSANVVLQSLDGTQRVAIWDDKVKITATRIILDTPVTEITGEVIAGTGSYGKTATFNGNISTTGDVQAGTISLQDHVHSGVQSGGSNTGEPVP